MYSSFVCVLPMLKCILIIGVSVQVATCWSHKVPFFVLIST